MKTRLNTRDKVNGLSKLVECLESLGFPIHRNGKRLFTNLRNEKTPSVQLNEDGSFYDYGTGEYGTIVDLLMRFKGLSAGEAFREAEKYLGKPIDIENYQNLGFDTAHSKSEQSSKKKSFQQKVAFFRNLAKRAEHHAHFLEMLQELLPSVTERNKLLEIAEEFEIGYRTSPIPMLVMPIKDMSGNIVNLWKYNKKAEIKVVFESGCSETAFPLHKLDSFVKDNSKAIIVCEGQKDVLNAIANGFYAITSGSAHSLFSYEVLKKLGKNRIAIYGDFDESGKRFAENIKAQFRKELGKVPYVFDWQEAFGRVGIKNPKKGYDLTDFLTEKKEKK